MLIVEDESFLATVLAREIEQLGIEVTIASTLHAAADVLDQTWMLIILDFVLPDGNGGDLLRLARARNPHQPVILMSGSEDKRLDDLILAHELAFLDKPFPLNAMLTFVRGVMSERDSLEIRGGVT